jgi:hypothetical protein
MRAFNYSAIRNQKWDSEILGLIAAIYKEAGKQELYLKQRPEELEKLVEIAKIQSTASSNAIETSVYKGYKRDKIEMRVDRVEVSDFPLYLNTVAGGLDRRDQTIGGFSFVVKIYAVPVVEIIG